MEAFDTPVPDRSEPNRQTTTIAPQALILLNSQFVNDRAAALAKMLLEPSDRTDTAVIQTAFQKILARDATPEEQQALAAFLERRAAESPPPSRSAAIQQLALLILNLNEFVYVD